MIRSATFVATLLYMPVTFAANAALGDTCAAYSQAEMRKCYEQHAKASADELASAEKAADAALARWDEDAKYRTSAKTAFKNANKSFTQFQQAQCNFSAALGGGATGNALTVRRLACVSDLNRQQAAWLRQATADLPVR
jgi:ribosomal protein S20